MGNKIWLRISAELDLTASELEELLSGQCSASRLLELIQNDRCNICGNTDCPEIEQNGTAAGLEWDLPKTTAARFYVDTPDGVLMAYRTGDIDYPGIGVDLKAAEEGEIDVSLSLTEYIPSGEGISDYDPHHPDEMDRQSAEAPKERRQVGEDGRPEISPGFVTRGWPNERTNQELYHRIFHYGYSMAAEK